MKLCVFQGTFNPIHRAHLDMAEFILKNYGFEKIVFIPAAAPPHKEYDRNMASHRLNMVKIALKYNPKFEVSDVEFQLAHKSYSYLTALELYKRYEVDVKISFIIGTDAFEKIESWYESKKFKELVDFIVFVRENNFDEARFEHLKEKGYNFKFAAMPYVDISSTELRKRIKHGEPVQDLITKEVEEYIKQNDLYKN